jgi:peptide/nickel transport system substrate-binding protein
MWKSPCRSAYVTGVEFLVLGPVEVRIDGRALSLGGPKQRALLALLLLNPNEVVSRDRLVDSLWGERAPASAQRSLDTYVSRLRALVGGDRIERHAPGYLIRVEPGELDLERFEALLEQGRAAAAGGDAAQASAVLGEALVVWRGRALADLENEPFAASESERLEERRLLAVEGRIDAALELGRGGELVGELERLVAEHPFRERLLGQLMLALYRAGRQADALAAYQTGRRRLAAELGLEPGPELRELERRILAHDPTLTALPRLRRVAQRHRLRHRWLVAAAVSLVVVGASIAAGIELGTGASNASNARASADGVSELNPNAAAVIRTTQLHDWPAAMAADRNSLWLAEPNAAEVVRIDRVTRNVEQIPVSGSPALLALGGSAAWVTSALGPTITRIDPATDRRTTISLGRTRANALAYGFGRLWVADQTDAELLAIDPKSGDVVQTFHVDVRPTALAVGAGALWAADYGAGTVTEINPRSGKSVLTISVGNGPTAIASRDGSVWVANALDSTVSRIDPALGRVVATISVGSKPVALAVTGTAVFVGNEYSSSVSRIDARSNVVVHTSLEAGGPTALVAAGGRVWIGTRAFGEHRGRTLVLLHQTPLSLDPALQGDLPPPQSNGLTNDALLTYVPIGGTQHLVPDLAENIPTPTEGGTAYTFRLHPGLRYSNGQPVRAEDFRRAIERLFRLQSFRTSNYMSIVGADSCDQFSCDLRRGIVTDDATRTITLHLRASDPDFLGNLALISSTPVPPGTPFHDTSSRPIPGTGPYMVKNSNEHEVVYVRNPRFREWSHAAQPDGNPDQIVMRYGLSPAQEVRAIERGQADWTADGVPAALLREVTTRFPGQLHDLLTTETEFLWINTQLPPFNDVRVRRALNLAIDRAKIARMYGGRRVATPTCQLLPPGIFGYHPYCPYTRLPSANGQWRAPDLARARRLVAASGTRSEQVTVSGPTDAGIPGTQVVPYVVAVLRELGYRARARLVPTSQLFAFPAIRSRQILPVGNLGFTPHQFFALNFTCLVKTHFFCNHQIDQVADRAQALEATDPLTAGRLWASVDRQLVDQAALVPFVNKHELDFFSKRVHNYEANPSFGLIADQAWLR